MTKAPIGLQDLRRSLYVKSVAAHQKVRFSEHTPVERIFIIIAGAQRRLVCARFQHHGNYDATSIIVRDGS